MKEFIYTLEEQAQLSEILDGIQLYFEEQLLLLGEELKYEEFLEGINNGSIQRAVKYNVAKKRRIDKKFDSAVDGTIDAALDGGKRDEIKSIREDLMRGRGKVSTILRRAFKCAIIGVAGGAAGGGIALAPALGLIAFIFSTLRRRDISRRERDKIIFELEQELEIVEEKIKDAEADNNKKLKYQYIRIRSELKRNLTQFKKYGKIQQRDEVTANVLKRR